MAGEKNETTAGLVRAIRIPTGIWEDLKRLALARGQEDASRLCRFELKKIRDQAREAGEI